MRFLLGASLLFITASFAGAETFAEKMVLATYKLFNRESTATGFVVEAEDGKHFVVTSAHVFEQMEGEKMMLVLRKGLEDGSYERADVEVAVRDGEETLWAKHPEQDVAVLELEVELPEGVELRSLPEGAIADEDDAIAGGLGVAADVWIGGYPTRFEVNGAGFPVTRRGCVASYPVVKSPTMIVDFTTFEGDSGGPVFVKNGDDPLVVGLVVSQFRHTEKVKTFTGEQTIHHPLGLSTVVRGTSILETLELAKGK